MRIFQKIFLALCLVSAVVFLFARGVGGKHAVVVVMYHNVDSAEKFRDDTVSPQNFERQLKFLKTHHYQILTLDQLVDGINAGKKFEHNCVAVTFDDGMKNNFTQAYPILERYKIPACFFVPTGKIGEPGFLSWDDVVAMKKGGMSFGSHSVNHAYLPELSVERQIYEIKESKKILENKLGTKIDYFAYPIGGFNQSIKDILKNSGYTAGFTTNRSSTGRFKNDVYEIPRIRFGDHDTNDLILTLKLSGYYNLFRKSKKSD